MCLDEGPPTTDASGLFDLRILPLGGGQLCGFVIFGVSCLLQFPLQGGDPEQCPVVLPVDALDGLGKFLLGAVSAVVLLCYLHEEGHLLGRGKAFEVCLQVLLIVIGIATKGVRAYSYAALKVRRLSVRKERQAWSVSE